MALVCKKYLCTVNKFCEGMHQGTIYSEPNALTTIAFKSSDFRGNNLVYDWKESMIGHLLVPTLFSLLG